SEQVAQGAFAGPAGGLHGGRAVTVTGVLGEGDRSVSQLAGTGVGPTGHLTHLLALDAQAVAQDAAFVDDAEAQGKGGQRLSVILADGATGTVSVAVEEPDDSAVEDDRRCHVL